MGERAGQKPTVRRRAAVSKRPSGQEKLAKRTHVPDSNIILGRELGAL